MEARRHLGDEVVLLESVPADGEEPARITVMAEKDRRTVSARAGTGGGISNGTGTARRQNGQNGYGYHAHKSGADLTVAQEDRASTDEPFSANRGDGVGGDGAGGGATNEPTQNPRSDDGATYGVDVGRRSVRDLIDDDTPTYPEPRRRSLSAPAGRGQIFPTGPDAVQGRSSKRSGSSFDAVEQLLKAQLSLLHNRLDNLERQFGGAIIGAAQRWTTNPLFSDLLDQGFQPGTVTRFFDTLATKGFSPDADHETLKWALAQEVRRAIGLCAIRETHGAQVFVGPSGSGKTSLLLKLAKHSGFYGRRQTAIISISPEEEDRSFHNSPVELFRSHGLPVQTVSTMEEMHKAVLRVQHFDHILIDTPSFPMQPGATRKALRHVKRLVDPILPLRIQLVVNATRSLHDFDVDTVRGLPLRPEALALTHLDETPGWGRVAEWLIALEMPVQFVSTSPAVPDGVISFSPSWFVEEMMKL